MAICAPHFRQFVRASFEKSRATGRRRIPPIRERVDQNIRYSGGLRGVRERDEMLVMTVHAAVGNQSKKMEPMAAGARKSFLRDRIAGEFAFRDRLIDSSKILINDSAGPEIEMAYFGVPHLALRQADIETARAQLAARIFAIEPVVKWRAREQGGVAVFFALFLSARVDAPAVANDEHDRLRHGGAVCRRSAERTSAFFR